MSQQHDLHNLRHSAAHLLAAAVVELWPNSKLTIGPSTEDGFYYDIEFQDKISEESFAQIEQKMHEIAKTWDGFSLLEVSAEQAKQEFNNNPYKLELIEDLAKNGETITFVQSGEFQDLCRGGHVEHPKDELKHFKLLKIAGAYWRGNEKNTMLTRIYGTIFPTKEELQQYLTNLEEAKKRDHKKLGKELELFTMTNDVGPGLTIWLPNGAIIRREIENYMVKEQEKMGFKHVYSPHIGRKSLWETSGHWDLYREKMYSPMDVEGSEYLVKPMTCPMHIQTYQFRPRSYRELPFRIAEIASVYRYEQSGELNGLLRVRAFTQDDAHIFCTQEQTVDEFLSVFFFIQRLYKIFGFTDYKVRLGIRSKKEKYLGDDSLWEKAQEKIIEALKQSGADYFISEGDAAFYGPKADFLINDALGREWQCGTVQVDFMLPERFGLKYIDQDGKEKTPVMIHRAPLGSLERFLAILIESYAGAFPTWIAPLQTVIIPISQDQNVYAEKVLGLLKEENIRVENWNEAESMQNRIRKAEKQKVPYMLVVGKREEAEGTVSIRTRGNKQGGTTSIEEFAKAIREEIENKTA